MEEKVNSVRKSKNHMTGRREGGGQGKRRLRNMIVCYVFPFHSFEKTFNYLLVKEIAFHKIKKKGKSLLFLCCLS